MKKVRTVVLVVVAVFSAPAALMLFLRWFSFLADHILGPIQFGGGR